MFRQIIRRGAAPLARQALRCCPQVRVAAVRGLLTRSGASGPLLRPMRPLVPRLSRAMSEDSGDVGGAEAGAGGQGPEHNASFSSLSGLIHPNLLRGITEKMGYDKMTPVQALTIQPALEGKDLVAQAKTGTGKTIGFLLPLFQRMIQEDPSLASRSASYRAMSNDIRGIVISPTRELAEQIADEARRLAAYTGLVVQSAVGGTQKGFMLQRTRAEGCHLLVATPGRLNDLLSDQSSGIAAPNLAAMVLDEADRILDVGFLPQIEEIQSHLPVRAEKERQTMLFSATIPHGVVGLARNMVRPDNFDFIQTIPENDVPTHEKVAQHIVPVRGFLNVFPSLFELIEKEAKACPQEFGMPFKAIVYFNYTSLVKLAISWFNAAGFGSRRYSTTAGTDDFIPSYGIHSGLEQPGRTRAADMFRNSKTGILLSSDVTARGMDFPNVTHVIQVEVPRTQDTYIHRVGRTGRQDKPGKAWTLMPSFQMKSARQTLAGLPVNLNNSLENAEYNPTDGGTPPAKFAMAVEAAQRIREDDKADAYRALIGQICGYPSGVESLNEFITVGCGLPQTPMISSRMASMMGLNPQQVNIGHVERRDSDSFGGGGYGRSNSSFGSSGGRFDRRGGGGGGGGGRGGGGRYSGEGSRDRFGGSGGGRRSSF